MTRSRLGVRALVVAVASSAALAGAGAIPSPRAEAAACDPAWRIVPSPNRGEGENGLASVAVVSADDVWAVGSALVGSTRHTLVEHFGGSAWSIVPSPDGAHPTNYLTGVSAAGPDDVWAVGYTRQGDPFQGQSFTLIEHFDGTSWSVVPSPNPIPVPNPGGYPVSNELYGVHVVAPDNIWAVGHSYTFTLEQTLILHYDGSAWSAIDAPRKGRFSRLRSIDGTSGSDLWAVGEWDNGLQRTLVEHFDGTSWSIVPSPNDGPYVQYLSDVSAESTDDVWAVGWHLAVFGVDQVYQTSSYHWDGTQWTVVQVPDVNRENNYLRAVEAVGTNNVWSVGFWDNTAQLRTLTERWNGTRWKIIASPSRIHIDELLDVESAPDGLWAVGQSAGAFSFRTLIQRFSCS